MKKSKLITNDDISIVKSVAPLFAETEEHGTAIITRMKFEDAENPLFDLRQMRDGGRQFCIPDGHYARLRIGGKLVMSDTPMERHSNAEFVRRANGKVLVAGLGIGLIIQAALKKPDVTHIAVIENNRDVIRLVKPKFHSPKFNVICADIHDWKPNGAKFDTIYFDIWPEISEDNLADVAKLHNRFKWALNRKNPAAWMGSWMAAFLRRRRAAERRSNNW